MESQSGEDRKIMGNLMAAVGEGRDGGPGKRRGPAGEKERQREKIEVSGM